MYDACTVIINIIHNVSTLCSLLTLLLHLTAALFVSLELQGGECSDQLTLICRHSDVPTDPVWIHNGTAEDGQLLPAAFPGSVYSVQTSTEHRVTVSGMDSVQALNRYIFQCVYSVLGNITKSNAVKYLFIPPGQSHSQLYCKVYRQSVIMCL